MKKIILVLFAILSMFLTGCNSGDDISSKGNPTMGDNTSNGDDSDNQGDDDINIDDGYDDDYEWSDPIK